MVGRKLLDVFDLGDCYAQKCFVNVPVKICWNPSYFANWEIHQILTTTVSNLECKCGGLVTENKIFAYEWMVQSIFHICFILIGLFRGWCSFQGDNRWEAMGCTLDRLHVHWKITDSQTGYMTMHSMCCLNMQSVKGEDGLKVWVGSFMSAPKFNLVGLLLLSDR